MVALLLSLAFLLFAAMIGAQLATRLGQPAVLGELLAGLLVGNLGSLTRAAFPAFDFLKDNATLDLLATIGVVLLLFEVGLESTVRDMLEVGRSSFFVALLGAMGTFALGGLVGVWLLPSASAYSHVFLAASLTATSVGITARVFKDLRRSQSHEARIILGAAVVDDILGLAVLAAVTITAANEGGSLSRAGVGAMISVGAFGAGLAVNNARIAARIRPIVGLIVPFFFVTVGLRADLSRLGQPGVAGLAVALTTAAVLGKQLCGFGASGKGLNRLSIGIGMIPRGEVELVFANLGLTLVAAGQPVVDQSVFSAIVVMVIATTVITPPALKWSFERAKTV